MTVKRFQRMQQWFHRWSKNCGKLRLEGRELNINDVLGDTFVVQDAFGLEPVQKVKRTDERISELELQSAFL